MTTNPPTARPMQMRQDNPGGDHRRAKNQPDERRYHPTPVMHVGIAGAN